MSTTETENKEVMRRTVKEVWSEGNLDRVDEVFADDFVQYTNLSPEPVRGPEAFKELVLQNRTAFPDIEVTVEEVIAEGDKVVLRTRSIGTHEGEFMGIEPTATEVETEAFAITRIEDGKIVEGRLQVDLLSVLQQLGIVELPGE